MSADREQAENVKRWKAQLVTLREQIMADGDIAIEPARRDASQIAGDDDEAPLLEMSQVIASKRNRDRTTTLGLILKALRRLEESPDDFGACKECGDPIGKRLERFPYVELCIECQAEIDGDPDTRKRPRRHLRDYR
jgi:RNA polymerase-binding transcription factor DksA